MIEDSELVELEDSVGDISWVEPESGEIKGDADEEGTSSEWAPLSDWAVKGFELSVCEVEGLLAPAELFEGVFWVGLKDRLGGESKEEWVKHGKGERQTADEELWVTVGIEDWKSST